MKKITLVLSELFFFAHGLRLITQPTTNQSVVEYSALKIWQSITLRQHSFSIFQDRDSYIELMTMSLLIRISFGNWVMPPLFINEI